MILILVIAFLSTTQASQNGWSYDNGPEKWVKKYPDCGGKQQSPIDIKKGDAEAKSKSSDLPLKTFVNYKKYSKKSNLKNNGHSVQLIIEDFEAQFTNSDSNKKYNFVQLHFHWGSKNDKGSEHSFDNKHFALEAHLVHQMAEQPNALAVVAVLFKVDKNDNKGLEPIVETLSYVRTVNSTKDLMRDFRLLNLLPDGKFEYYTYSGSLTTPPCTENVTWIVSKSTNKIGMNQLETFRSLEMNAFDLSINERGNARPVQELNGRTIFHSSNAVVIVPNILLFIFILLGRSLYFSDFKEII